MGGPGSGGNYGLNVAGSQLGGVGTYVLTMSAASLGLGSSEYGINVSGGGSVVVGNGATMALTGVGGGIYSGAGTGNHGVYLNNANLTSTGANATTMTVTGLGGQGSGGTNAGAYIDAGGLTVSFGSNANNGLNFLNCIGGFVGSQNYGVGVFGVVNTTGGVTQFLNACGGGNGAGQNNDGLHFAANYLATAVVAQATGGFGHGMVGVPTSGNVGIYVGSGVTVGGANANQIHLTGSSLGTGSYEFGIALISGTLQVNNNGTISLKGIGGGLYNSTGGNNYGVQEVSATLATGTNGIINVSGSGGYGSGGHNTAVVVDLTVNDPTITYSNIVGGFGGSFNYGVEFATSLNVVDGTINFFNVVGGSGGAGSTDNNGVNIDVGVSVAANAIVAQDCYGGQGTARDIGFNINGNLGSLATGTYEITIAAGSLGTGSNEYGIQVLNSAVQVTDGGTVSFNGSGGGLYNNGTGTANHGVNLSGAAFSAGNGGTKATSVTISGIGGTGLVGVNHGVNLTGGFVRTSTTRMRPVRSTLRIASAVQGSSTTTA